MCVCRLNAENPIFRAPLLFIFIIIFVSFLIFILHDYLTRVKHGIREISAKQYQCFSVIADDSEDFRVNLLRPILIPRVSGTPENRKVRDFIVSKLRALNIWHIELDTFVDKTPLGNIEFSNIVATLDPTATRRLVLACHYDSKKLPNFVGATDSAVPCAMLLDIAIGLQKQLNELKQNKGNPTLQLIFFDGEEAFGQWSATDSIYGAKHLANKMRSTNVPQQQSLNQIDAMDMFVLLDLVGDKSMKFVNFFDRTTGRYYNRLSEIEKQLLRAYNKNTGPKGSIFSQTVTGSYIEDDHIPFLHLDVPILHLISTPFPWTWHTENDNESNLSFPSITHLRNVMKIFVIEYLHLNPQLC